MQAWISGMVLVAYTVQAVSEANVYATLWCSGVAFLGGLLAVVFLLQAFKWHRLARRHP